MAYASISLTFVPPTRAKGAPIRRDFLIVPADGMIVTVVEFVRGERSRRHEEKFHTEC